MKKHAFFLLWLLSLGCTTKVAPPSPSAPVAAAPVPAGSPLFQEVTKEAGIDFSYRNGQEANHYAILESLGGGVGMIDFDKDGKLDLFFPGGGWFDGTDKKQIKGHPCRLYRNMGSWKFQDVTKEAGLDSIDFYTHGCAVGDYDNDGFSDLLVTGWGRLALFHNETDGKGGRRFVDVTAKAGLTDKLWSSSAAFADLDGDGYPELYVCHYANWSWENHPRCEGYGASVAVDVCPPKRFEGLPHVLYRNNRDGTFTDVSKEAGLYHGTKNDGKGLGVLVVDLNKDNKPDIYVANDTVDNFLYLNRSSPGKLRFDEVAMASGVARDDSGVPNGSMGVDAGDYDGSGWPSLWVTNYENEMHALYRNQGKGLFLFSTQVSGIAAIGQKYVGFGTRFVDLDNKGREDIVVANGHVIRHPVTTGLQQKPVILRNLGNKRFKDATAEGGAYFHVGHIGRGLAVGDLDNDGWPDAVFSNLNEPAAVLRNIAKDAAGKENHWIGVELTSAKSRDQVGAVVMVEVGGKTLTRFVKGGTSYLSASDPRSLFGIGAAEMVDRLKIQWADGETQEVGANLSADRYYRLEQGKGLVGAIASQ